jgi:hypothetical protein
VPSARAKRLAEDAEDVALLISSEYEKATVLIDLVLSATEPERAVWLTLDAEAIVATDPERAEQLVIDAERAVESITSESEKASALASLGQAIAAAGLTSG